MIIYLIWRGEYQDAYIDKAFISQLKASEYLDECNKTNQEVKVHVEEVVTEDDP